MYSIIQTQTDLSALVTLEEAKRQCRLLPSFTLDDDDLTHLIATCAELAQVYTHRLLTIGTVIVECDEYRPTLVLPWGNVTSIDQVLLDGVESTDYTFSPVTQKLKVNRSYSNIKVTYEAGFTELPSRIKQGILMMISTWYNNREDYITGMTVEKIPLSALKCLDSVRYWNA